MQKKKQGNQNNRLKVAVNYSFIVTGVGNRAMNKVRGALYSFFIFHLCFATLLGLRDLSSPTRD